MEIFKKQVYKGGRLNKHNNGSSYLVLSSLDVECSTKSDRPILDIRLQPVPAANRKKETKNIDSDVIHWEKKSRKAASDAVKDVRRLKQPEKSHTSMFTLKHSHMPDVPEMACEDSPHVFSVLKPYQQNTVLLANKLRRLKYKGGICADQMGLGKTVEAAAWIFLNWRQVGRDILFVSPKSVRNQTRNAFIRHWQDFQFQHLKEKMKDLSGPVKQRMEDLSSSVLESKKIDDNQKKDIAFFNKKGNEQLTKHIVRIINPLETKKRLSLIAIKKNETEILEIKKLDDERVAIKEIADIEGRYSSLNRGYFHENQKFNREDTKTIQHLKKSLAETEKKIKNFRNPQWLAEKIEIENKNYEGLKQIYNHKLKTNEPDGFALLLKQKKAKKQLIKTLNKHLIHSTAHSEIKKEISDLKEEEKHSLDFSIRIKEIERLQQRLGSKVKPEDKINFNVDMNTMDGIFQDMESILVCPATSSGLKNELLSRVEDVDQVARVIFTTPSQLEKAKRELKQVSFGSVAVDEAHLAKDPLSSLAVNLKRIKKDFTMLFTGTPFCNSVKDLFSLFEILGMVAYESEEDYLERLEDASTELMNAVVSWGESADRPRVNGKTAVDDGSAYIERKNALSLFSKLLPLYRDTRDLREAPLQTVMSRHETTDEDVINAWKGRIPAKSVKKINCKLTKMQQKLLTQTDDGADIKQFLPGSLEEPKGFDPS